MYQKYLERKNKLKNNTAEIKVGVELTHIAENIIDNYVRLEIKNVIIKNKKDNWKHISFDYKDKDFN